MSEREGAQRELERRFGQNSEFTMENYNDRAKPCLKPECEGLVYPTWNCNVGQCNACEEKYSWERFR